MQYLLVIYDNPEYWARVGEAQMDATMRRHGEISDDLKKAGKFGGCGALMPPASATCVRRSGDKTTITDGPYAETKEQLGGYYLVEARDLNEAIAIAARIPGARYGAIEVRPIPAMTGAARPA